jgi:hypothetical protein
MAPDRRSFLVSALVSRSLVLLRTPYSHPPLQRKRMPCRRYMFWFSQRAFPTWPKPLFRGIRSPSGAEALFKRRRIFIVSRRGSSFPGASQRQSATKFPVIRNHGTCSPVIGALGQARKRRRQANRFRDSHKHASVVIVIAVEQARFPTSRDAQTGSRRNGAKLRWGAAGVSKFNSRSTGFREPKKFREKNLEIYVQKTSAAHVRFSGCGSTGRRNTLSEDERWSVL